MDTSRNIPLLYRYNLFTSVTLSVVANGVLIDQLMLKLNIDIGDFGIIKSMMFLAPALSYQLAIPLLRKLDCPEQVCAYSYAIRVFLPCLLPFLGIFGAGREVITIAAMLILGLCGALAAFANNSLSLIYRQTFPENRYNHFMGKIMLLISLPAVLINLSVAWILKHCENYSGNTYLWIFALLQIITVSFEIPAFKAIWKVQTGPRKPVKIHFHLPDFIVPFYDREYRRFLLFCSGFGVIFGIISTYFIVYLYNERHWSVMRVMLWSTLFSLISLAVSSLAGKRFDRISYPALFTLLSGMIFIGSLATGFALDTTWGMLIAMIFIWNGWGSALGAVLATVLNSAAGRLASKENTIFFISLYSLTLNFGQFIGSALAGLLLRMVSYASPEGNFNFQGFFRLSCAAAFLLLFFTTLWWRKNVEKIS
ncbi:MAG: MFS transporter [Lentisphaeria bacterium]